MARRLFPDGTLIDHGNGLDATLGESRSALHAPSCGDVVFRPVVMHGRLVAEMDIVLANREGRLDLYEVKSGSDIKGEYLPDIAFQRHVAGKAGLDICESAVITINTDYLRQGSVDPSGLFRIMDVTGDVEDLLKTMGKDIAEALRIMDSPDCPDTPIGQHCDGCPLADTPDGCHKRIHDEPCNVFTLYRLQTKRAWGWYGQGILKNSDIPADYPLTEKQRIQIKAEATGEPHINRGQIRAFFNQMEFPLHFLDFETFAPAIPILQNSTPCQQIPFQYNLHIQTAPGQDPKDIRHHSWIWDGGGDPRIELLGRLEGLLGQKGSIIVYNAQFERMILRQAVVVSPEHVDWLAGILDRFVDLLEPFRSFHYYHPGQHGGASIKAVLPVLTGKSYEGMEISNGMMASMEFMRVMTGEAGKKDRQKVMERLEEYCGLDTWGMVEIVGRLEELSGASTRPERFPRGRTMAAHRRTGMVEPTGGCFGGAWKGFAGGFRIGDPQSGNSCQFTLPLFSIFPSSPNFFHHPSLI